MIPRVGDSMRLESSQLALPLSRIGKRPQFLAREYHCNDGGHQDGPAVALDNGLLPGSRNRGPFNFWKTTPYKVVFGCASGAPRQGETGSAFIVIGGLDALDRVPVTLAWTSINRENNTPISILLNHCELGFFGAPEEISNSSLPDL